MNKADIKYMPVTDVVKDVFAGLSCAYIEAEHKKLLGYVARLNREFPCRDSRIIIIAGNSQSNTVDILLATGEKVPVILSGIGKADNTYMDGYISGTLSAMYEKAHGEFTGADEIKFGRAVSDHADSIIRNVHYNTPFLTSKLYHYLKTMFECVQFIRKHHDTAPMNDNALKREVNTLMVKFGLNSVDDRPAYSRCPYRKWDGRQFSLHLRPTTKNNAYVKYSLVDTETMRVYFSLEYTEKQILVGMICQHPRTCGRCGEFDTCPARKNASV
jgi:hypothetical protein